MTVHIATHGPRRLTVSFVHDAEHPARLQKVMQHMATFLEGHEHPRGGRFMTVPCDPIDDTYQSAVAMIDNWHDADEPPLFANMHRHVHAALKKAGVPVSSPEPA